VRCALLLASLLLGAGALEAQQLPNDVPRATGPDTTRARAPGARRGPGSDGYIFLRPGIDYGSASVRTPADAFANRAFSILVFDGQERELGRLPWSNGWAAVRDALLHPGRAIERAGGWRQVAREELLPNSGHVWTWAWAPNYGGHIVAGGIAYRFMGEWFEAHGMPAPRLVAALAFMGAAVTNEAMEMPGGPPGVSGTLADLLVFDPAGMALFSFDAPARFLARTLLAADWSPMPTLGLPGARLMNFSQVMSYKLPLPLTDRARVLLLIGQSANSGLSFALGDGYSVAGAAGFETQRRYVDPVTGRESVVAAWSGGAYLDRDNSLLVSVLLSQRVYTGLQVNVYPGVLPGPLRPAGVWVIRSRQGEWSTGVAFRRTLGLGLGLDFAR